MKKRCSRKALSMVTGLCCMAILFGCTTSQVVEPTKSAVYEADQGTGFAAVPFTGLFLPLTFADVDPDSIEVTLKEGADWFGDEIYKNDPEDPVNVFDFTLDGPSDAGTYTVAGTMQLLPGVYTVSTRCFPDPTGAYFSNGSDSAQFTVESSFEPSNFTGGLNNFKIQSTIGTCFWTSDLFSFGIGYELFILYLMNFSNVAVPGWNDLPASMLLMEDFPGPITAALSILDGTIGFTTDPASINFVLPEEDWMEMNVMWYGEPHTYWLCGFEWSFGDGRLNPYTPTATNMDLLYHDMAFKIAETNPGECIAAKAPSLFEMTSPFDAKPECTVETIYRGTNP